MGIKTSEVVFIKFDGWSVRRLTTKMCEFYINDITIYSPSQEQHLKNLDAVFSKLSKANLKINVDKCAFIKL